MYLQVKFITQINYKDFATSYFYSSRERILLPIEGDNYFSNPSVLSVVNNILGRLKVRVKAVVICKELDTYYAFLIVNQGQKDVRIKSTFYDGVEIAKTCQANLYVRDSVLKENGFKVTKELVEDALRSTSCSDSAEY